MTEYHDEIMRELHKRSAGTGLQIPSTAFADTGGYFVDYVPMRSLICEFPAPAKSGGMDGAVQFGWIANLIEHTIETLAFLVSNEPCTPVNLNIHCIRPMGVLHGPITVEAKLRNRSRSLVYAEAKVSSGEHRTVATAASTLTVGLYQRD